MASPHKQPLAVAKLKGADKKNPKRYKDAKAAPMPELGIGDFTVNLSPGARAVWTEVEPLMVTGVLTVADRLSFAALCELTAEFREDPREFSGTKLGKMITLLSLFGMTPVDRAKIRIEKPEAPPENPFESFTVVQGGK